MHYRRSRIPAEARFRQRQRDTPAASLRSLGRLVRSRAECPSLLPLLHRDRRAVADLRTDLELVHEPLRSGQTDAHSFARRIAVLHDLRDVGDAGTLILDNDLYSRLRTFLQQG